LKKLANTGDPPFASDRVPSAEAAGRNGCDRGSAAEVLEARDDFGDPGPQSASAPKQLFPPKAPCVP